MLKQIFLSAISLLIGNINAQSKDSVKIEIEINKFIEVCRYCEDQGYHKQIVNCRFVDNNMQVKYNKVCSQIRGTYTVLLLADYDKLTKVCDISRTGKHGIDTKIEPIKFTRYISLDFVLETQAKIDAAETKRVNLQNLNRQMLIQLDSFEWFRKELLLKKDSNLLAPMLRCSKTLMDLAGQRDGQDKINYSTNIVIELDGDGGFGYVYKDFSYEILEAKLLYAMITLGKDTQVLKIIDKRISQQLLSKNLFLLKGMLLISDGEFLSAANTFTKGYGLNNPALCTDINNMISDFRVRRPNNKNFKTFGITKLQISLSAFNYNCQFTN